MLSRSKDRCRILSGMCPDKKCRSKLFFPFFDTSIECTHCGQRHDRAALQNIQEVSDLDITIKDMVRNILMSNMVPKRGTEMVKVLGLSNYHCKLLSPLLTKYGMDKKTSKAKLLSAMNQGDIFDCGLFGDRAFLIDQEHLAVPGFGRDVTGSMSYLAKTLDIIKAYNDGDERLVPIHADGDGHCLVHAVSRALVGRELFWHPLRCSLKKHFEDNIETYKELFKDFVDENEWKCLIDECDPDFVPPEGELLGLRNMHVFGLANVLKRPIILLDSLECMQSLGDYAALFLPSLVSPNSCKGKNDQLNRPLCIAWSSPGHNHYIPLVGIKKKPLPALPHGLIPKVWGVPQKQIFNYMEFDEKGSCAIGGNRSLGDPYIRRLVSAMEELFAQKNNVHPSLVADVHHYLYQSTGVVGADQHMVIQNTTKAVGDGRLYRCLNCDAICEQIIQPHWFRAGGVLYNMAHHQYGIFVPNKLYPFHLHGIVCRYDRVKDELVPDLNLSGLESCTWCNEGTLRKVKSDGSIMYKNEDKTKTPSTSSTCSCGYKHYWCGKEYDSPPQKLNVTLDWNNKVIKDSVAWFENESDPNLNSNVYNVASEVVQRHFPGEFGSERLVQRVVEQLLNQTKLPDAVATPSMPAESSDTNNETLPSKMIISGKGILHKEELGISETERRILQRIETHAPVQQKRQTNEKLEEANKCVEVAKVATTVEKDVSKTLSASTSTLVPSVSSKVEFVRVVTSDGRQAQLHLEEEGIKYDELQDWINSKFQIPPSSQKIKYGFPPQELQAPALDKESQSLPLSHGDRVIVEMIQETKALQNFLSSANAYMQSNTNTSQIHNLKQAEEHLLQVLDSLPVNDPLEMQSVAISISASLSNQSVWDYAKKIPQLFRRNGVFYLQVARDVGLENKKHCNLRTFPDKTFCYNADTDCLELCIEPHGHFPIHADIDDDIQKAFKPMSTITGDWHSAAAKLLNSLRKENQFSPFFDSKLVLNGPDSVEQTTDGATSNSNLEERVGSPPHTLVRKGPGYSVISHNDALQKTNLKRLQLIANQVTGGKSVENMSKVSLSRKDADIGDMGYFHAETELEGTKLHTMASSLLNAIAAENTEALCETTADEITKDLEQTTDTTPCANNDNQGVSIMDNAAANSFPLPRDNSETLPCEADHSDIQKMDIDIV